MVPREGTGIAHGIRLGEVSFIALPCPASTPGVQVWCVMLASMAEVTRRDLCIRQGELQSTVSRFTRTQFGFDPAEYSSNAITVAAIIVVMSATWSAGKTLPHGRRLFTSARASFPGVVNSLSSLGSE